jgi:hypothetical protein
MCFCAMFTTMHAQSTFGLKVAYNRTTATSPVNYADTKGIDRIQLGIFGKLNLYKHFFVRGNITYNQKGNYYSDLYYMADAGKSVSIKLNYLEASADLGYTLKLIGKHKILAGVGPYLAYGLNGTEKGKMETIAGMRDFNRKVKFTNSDFNDGTKLQIKPIDFGLNFNIAYQYRKYGLFFNYGLGLTNRENMAYSYNSYNRVASVGFSYSFK